MCRPRARPTGHQIAQQVHQPEQVFLTLTGIACANPNCAVANGKGLQTWSGDGFLAAFCATVRLTHDYSLGHPLLGKVHPLIPIHDEIVGEVLDDGRADEYATRVAEVMVENFSVVLPDVKIKAQPVLMRRWDKNAEPVFDSVTKKLIPWEPTAK